MFKKHKHQKEPYFTKVEKLEGYEHLTPRVKKYLKRKHYTREFLEAFNNFCSHNSMLDTKEKLEMFLNKETGLERIVDAIRSAIRYKHSGYECLDDRIFQDVENILWLQRNRTNQ